MELELTYYEHVNEVLEDFPFEDEVEVECNVWHCPVCDYVEDTYDTE